MATSERAARPPMASVRQAPFALTRDTTEGGEPDDGLTLDGYGAVFNRLTIIDSWEGKFKEKIANGSMKRSFRETPPKIQFDHGRHPLIGSIPCAALRSITEDSDPDLAPEGGAHVIGRVFDNWLMEPIRDAIAAEAINGMSFRFEVVREQWEYADGKVIRDEDELIAELRKTWYDDVPDEELLIRTLKELKVPEIGPVVWPAYADTSVSVRSKVIDLGRIQQRDPEQLKLLAQAVFLADTAGEDAQRSTPAVGERKSNSDAQQSTDEKSAGERPSPKNDDAQRSTSAVGERPSTPRTFSNQKLRVMNQRDRLLNLRAVGERA
ncbi:HK97 family phage prohead protease [Mycolicibacterium fortuitum]|uniref:HK97 family phage prohead protease n=1 Tax=Mycolicibacterium fortuitum TaxID=1766 RepID=UPI00096E541C|nr:HK97 family phage prohead protease [Mycolicibacterium fortuitum]OMC02167.1 hypothetical protein A5734_14980 [Mycolicibacterium fortuitum]